MTNRKTKEDKPELPQRILNHEKLIGVFKACCRRMYKAGLKGVPSDHKEWDYCSFVATHNDYVLATVYDGDGQKMIRIELRTRGNGTLDGPGVGIEWRLDKEKWIAYSYNLHGPLNATIRKSLRQKVGILWRRKGDYPILRRARPRILDRFIRYAAKLMGVKPPVKRHSKPKRRAK